jgi:hypothetical protein
MCYNFCRLIPGLKGESWALENLGLMGAELENCPFGGNASKRRT